MKLSISNIGWQVEADQRVYLLMRELEFSGLEIAPTRIFPENPYGDLKSARDWAMRIKDDYGFEISSMQSIWYGRIEGLFGTDEERASLVDYTKKAINFARVIGCKNLVFGCPRNRFMPEGVDIDIAVNFFKEIGDYACTHHTVVAMEANPPIYNTNFINTTESAIELIEKVDSKGFLLNLDVGTMIENGESINVLKNKAQMINHIHISEPGLKPIQKREIHKRLADYIHDVGYNRFVSIEVGRQDDISVLDDSMKYIRSVFK